MFRFVLFRAGFQLVSNTHMRILERIRNAFLLELYEINPVANIKPFV